MRRNTSRGSRLRAGVVALAAVALTTGVVYAATTAQAASATQIKGAGSGRCIDVPGGASEGAQLEIWDCNGNANQAITQTGGEFQVEGLCLDAEGAATADGTKVVWWACNGGSNQKWSFSGSTIRNQKSGTCLDVTGAGTANGALLELWGCNGGSNQSWSTGGSTGGGGGSTPPPTTGSGGGSSSGDKVHGYATVNGTTTGGSGGSTVTVTSLSALVNEAKKSGTETIRVNGLFTGYGDIVVASNKTIIGVGSGSGVVGGGFKIDSVNNVIIQNLNISKVTAASGTGDAVHLEKSTHVWIDHNTLFSDQSHGKDYYDGLVDLSHAADYVTVSYNYFHDHYKASLVGHSDTNGAEDTGHLHVTYDHNYFQNINSRMPSLRFGTGHVYNNYFENGDTGVHSRENAQMLVQNNVFRGVSTPILTTGDSKVDGFVNQSGNDFGGGKNDIGRTGSFTNPPYSYSLAATSSVISSVTASAGAGHI